MLFTPDVREGESSDVGQRGDFWLLVFGIISPEESDKHLHEVHVLVVLTTQKNKKRTSS